MDRHQKCESRRRAAMSDAEEDGRFIAVAIAASLALAILALLYLWR